MTIVQILYRAGLVLICCAAPIRADTQGSDWTAKKCALYRSAVTDALQIHGRDGVSDGFIAQNNAFIAGGCIGPQTLCPVTDRDRTLTDLLTILTMNEGMASTFVPIGCPA